VDVQARVGDRDLGHEPLGEHHPESPGVELRGQFPAQRHQRVANAVAAPEHDARQTALELPEQRQRDREDEEQNERIPNQQARVGRRVQSGRPRQHELVEDPEPEEQHGCQCHRRE